MLKVTLPIFFKTEESKNQQLIKGDDYELGEYCDERNMVFYNINCIAPYDEDSKIKYTSVFSNGEEFICSLPIKEVEKIIDDANTEIIIDNANV